MKYQLCKFLRKRPTAAKLKSEVEWEKGIAVVKSFGVYDVDYIIDSQGKKVAKIYEYRLLTGLGFCAIDTDAEEAF